MNPTREPEPEPESFIRVWVRGYSGRVINGSTRLTRLLFRVGYGSRVIGFGSSRVGSTRYPRSKMNVTRQPEPEPDSFIRVWVRGYSGRVVNGSTRLTRILFGFGYGFSINGFGYRFSIIG